MTTTPDAAKIEEAVLSLACELEDDGRKIVSFEECDEVAANLGVHASVITRAIRALGFEVVREVAKRVRTISSNSHDRWSGPGSCATHGGSGWEQISGFAGQKG